MKLLYVLFALLMSSTIGPALAQNLGKYIGAVQTEWLDGGRKMRLLAPFAYIDPRGQRWDAPKDWIVDGASIPQFAWSIIGGPFEGKYREASVIHDVGCDQKTRTWESVHEVFYWAMLASKVESWRAKVMYAAVYHFGPRWDRVVEVGNLPRDQTPIARQRALEISRATSGSIAEIINIRPRPVPPFSNQQQMADFTVRISPPKPRLSEAEFEKLRAQIQQREGSPGSELSLSEIQAYRP